MHKICGRKGVMAGSYVLGATALAVLLGAQLGVLWMPIAYLFWVTLAIGSVCFLWGFLAPCSKIGARIRLIGFRWLGAFTYGFPVGLACFAVCFFWQLTGREVAIVYGVGAVVVVALLVYARVQALRICVRTYKLESEKVSAPYRIAFLSDLHFEAHTSFGRLARGIELLKTEVKPDLIVLCGDLFYDRVLTGASAAALREVFATMAAPCGVYACLGNHDIDVPNSNAYGEVEKLLANCGVTLLTDGAVELPVGVLYGRKDKHLRDRMPVKELLHSVENTGLSIVIDHQPSDILATAEAGADLLLCGHTHRGQLVPIPVFHACHLFYGRRQFGNLCAIVTAGFGWYGPPLRIGSTGEIGVVDILPKAEK